MAKKKFSLLFRFQFPLLLAVSTLFGSVAHAKDLRNRLGVGYRDAYSFSLPSLAVQYYPNSDYGFITALGLDTEDQNSRMAFSLGARRIIFREDNMNFFTGLVGSYVSKETAGVTDTGFEASVTAGDEFFFHGLENLGFNVETGISVTNLKKVRFRTLGDSFIKTGIIFYF